jgi:aspartyl aminopeptidase
VQSNDPGFMNRASKLHRPELNGGKVVSKSTTNSPQILEEKSLVIDKSIERDTNSNGMSRA